ncbi:MAG TPA: caspase family protein, partial [Campylobacterales bacterium]|nr:caspase family protein [Campylobacterales bacterium]
GFNTKILYNRQSLEIEKYLKSYDNLTTDDIFALYYTGHGSNIPDDNADESDGKDEVLVLSDGVRNIPFVDDVLNQNLNVIKAKKLVIFDSCHSGTAHKGNDSRGIMAKTLPSNLLSKPMSKGLIIGWGKEISGNYMVLSASKDYEQSLATTHGSLFTNELYRIFTNSSNKSMESILEEATYNIVRYSKQNNQNPHHPNFSFSNPSYKNISIDDYLQNQKESLQSQLDKMSENPQLNQLRISNALSSYNTNDFVNFSFDTNGARGYLSVLFVERNKVTVLYPNPKVVSKEIQGRYSFPKDFFNFKVRAFKNCNGCQEDKTTIYLLLTPQPLSSLNSMSRDKLLSFSKESNRAKVISKDVELVESQPTKQSSGLLIGRYEFVVR